MEESLKVGTLARFDVDVTLKDNLDGGTLWNKRNDTGVKLEPGRVIVRPNSTKKKTTIYTISYILEKNQLEFDV